MSVNTGYETAQTQDVMDGDLDGFIASYLRRDSGDGATAASINEREMERDDL